ncbi:MAG TPA: hypothetical protein VFG48_07990, partial [Xanthomonadales bacterium]|nr:hypothetical protein [Xanthomonadales bacterium]
GRPAARPDLNQSKRRSYTDAIAIDAHERNCRAPDISPKAYRRSSPIVFAAGLQDSLLIAAGMQDDNLSSSRTPCRSCSDSSNF